MELLIIDTTQIQPYIFGSNRLRENVVASYLVNAATQDWVVGNLPSKHNVIVVKERVGQRFGFTDDKIEDGALQAEVVYMGGGNAAILFDSKGSCSQFVRDHTRFVMRHAPNLQLVIYQRPFNFDQDNLYDVMTDIFENLLDQHKQARTRSNPLLGLGVTAVCQSTGLPAITMSETLSKRETPYPASAEIAAKTKKGNLDAANGRLRTYLQFDKPSHNLFEFPSDLDQIGRTEDEHSYIAIVHADGDGVGSRLVEIGAKDSAKNNPGAKPRLLNRSYVQTRRDFSIQLDQAARTAMQETLHFLQDKIKLTTDKEGKAVHYIEHCNAFGDVLPRLELKCSEHGFYLPFRPIVFGGDDITFICDGRLGLALANDYLKRFRAKTAQLLQNHIGELTASAGIAIVKSHYPFARAYGLAEDLGKSAKKYRTKLKQDHGYGGGCLDWHFAMSGLMGDLETIRDQHYQTPQGSLTVRPVTIEDNPEQAYRSWEFVYDGLAQFQDLDTPLEKGPNWSTRRNKIKALRDVLREGGVATKQFIKSYDIKRLPHFDNSELFEETGWNEKYCGYYDAIELADWYMVAEE